MTRRRRLAAFGLVCLLTGAAFGFNLFWTAATTRPGGRPDMPLDAIVVLTGGAERIQAGLDMLAAGDGARLYVSGAHQDVVLADILKRRPDLPPALAARIEIGYARDTAGNARETAEWAEANDVRSFALVTAYYHMPRSLILFHEADPKAMIWPVSVTPAGAGPESLLGSPRTVALILGEWMKYLATLAGFGR